MANCSDDALVARVRVYADLLESAEVFIGIDSLNGSGAAIDLRALLTAYATVQAERDARADALKEWDDRVGALQADLATLRETLAGEVEALFAQDGDDWSSGLNTGLNRAINIIRGTK